MAANEDQVRGNGVSGIEQTIRQIKPSLRQIAPYTFWSSIGFGLFNLVVGILLIDSQIFKSLQLLSFIPMWFWASVFMAHGAAMLLTLITNDWHITRKLHIVGVAIKSGWWLEILAATVAGFSPFLLCVWSLLIFLQVIISMYFTPRLRRD